MTDLPPGWAIAPLRDLVDVLDSKRVPVSARERSTRTGDVPYYGATGQVGWIDEAIFDEDLVLLGEDGVKFFDKDKPKAYMISGKSWVNNHAHVLRAKSVVLDRRYLTYYLNQIDYDRLVNGTTRLKLTRSAMDHIPVALPPLVEQRHIVAALEEGFSRLDAGTSLLDNVLSAVDVLECRLLRESLAPQSRVAFAKAPKPAPVDDGDLPVIPSSWRWMRLEEIAEVVGGVTKATAKQSDPSIPLVPYLRVANVQRGWLDLSQVSEIRVAEARAKALALEYGDVLLNEGGDRDKLGRGWVWEGQIDRCIHQNHVFRARIRNNQLHPKLLAWHANSFGKLWFERNGRQTTNLASIGLSKIKQLPVPVPPIEDQRPLVEYIEDHLAVTRRTVATVQQSMTRASQLRRSLLADAFAGRLAPQDPEDEPASVLLDRIRAERDKTGPTGRRRRASTLSGSRSNRGGADGR